MFQQQGVLYTNVRPCLYYWYLLVVSWQVSPRAGCGCVVQWSPARRPGAAPATPQDYFWYCMVVADGDYGEGGPKGSGRSFEDAGRWMLFFFGSCFSLKAFLPLPPSVWRGGRAYA